MRIFSKIPAGASVGNTNFWWQISKRNVFFSLGYYTLAKVHNSKVQQPPVDWVPKLQSKSTQEKVNSNTNTTISCISLHVYLNLSFSIRSLERFVLNSNTHRWSGCWFLHIKGPVVPWAPNQNDAGKGEHQIAWMQAVSGERTENTWSMWCSLC